MCREDEVQRRHEDEGAFGEVFIKHVLASAIKKVGPLEEIKIVII